MSMQKLTQLTLPKVLEVGKEGFASDQQKANQVLQLLKKYPRSEAQWMRWVSQSISQSATVYVGNSLPIREWDNFAQRENSFPVFANRGVNGIDGQLASALARLDSQKELWVVLGDLTTLYDSNALWFWKQNPQKLKLIIINNSGGKIFERLFARPLFYNSHDLQFKYWAAQWEIPYQQMSDVGVLPEGSAVIEVVPDPEQTKLFWKEYDILWSKD